jgi:hypothetical protein
MRLEKIVELLLKKNKLGFIKERSNLIEIFSNIEFKDKELNFIEASGRKNCAYTKLDNVLKEFCIILKIESYEFMKILSILTIIDSYYSCYFLKYEDCRNVIGLDKLMSNKARYLNKLVNLLVFHMGFERLSKVFSIEDEEVLSNFLCDLIKIRHSFLSSYFKYEFEGAWKIKLNMEVLEVFWKLNYIGWDVRYEEKFITLSKENIVENIIENSSFSSELWIYKFNLIKKGINKEKEVFLKRKSEGVFCVLNIVNFMNNCKFHINKIALVSIKNDNILKKLKNDNKYMTLLCLDEASYLRDLKWFRFDYILDNRTRIYIKNIPLNPQLEKIIRPLIVNEIQNDEIILEKYIRLIKEFNLKSNQIFSVLSLSNLIKGRLLEFINKDLELKKINKEKINLALYDEYLNIELIFIQQVYDILIRLEIKINNNIKDQLIKKISTYEELEDVGFFNELNNWIINDKKWIETMWYNDASANVLQILMLKLFIKNNKALKICNIFNNNTKSKDIYEYILNKVKNKETEKLISRKLIKRIVMPGLYGQTFISLREQFDEILKSNPEWIIKSNKEKNNIILKIEKKVWDEISLLGINISEYLTLLKRLPYETEKLYWENGSSMPIILDKEKSINRKNILNKINYKLINKEEGVTELKKILNKDDNNYIRKNIRITDKKYIKLRFRLKSDKIDKKALSNALTPSTNHADDASILLKTLEFCMKYEVECIPIHDSLGAMVYYSSLLKVFFKLSNFNYIENLLLKDNFPFNILNEVKFRKLDLNNKRISFLKKRNINKKYYIKNKLKIYEKILESKNFFK